MAEYLKAGLRPVPLYGVRDGRCLCCQWDCKPRDAGKHEPPETDGLWKDGHRFGPESFPDEFNVALAMGPQSNGIWLVALDADGPFDWSLLGPLPPTRTQQSPRGEHRIFSVEPYAPLGNWVDVLRTKPGPSLDLRYARGRLVVEPSRNAFGEYRWTDMREPAPLPEHVIDLILDERRQRGLPVLRQWEREGKRA